MIAVRSHPQTTTQGRRPRRALSLFVGLITSLGITAGDSPVVADDAAQAAGESAELFERHVRPLLIDHCAECHSAEDLQEGELALDASAGLKEGGSRGPLFVAGKPDESLLLRVLRYEDEDLQMPPSGKLDDAPIARVEEWIRSGAVVPEYGAGTIRKEDEIDFAAAREFWSFQPLDPQPAPIVEGDDWSREPIDRFVFQRLAEEQLTPSPEASRPTLIRRAAFDLIGLPPTPDEIERFVSDESPDAYERLIDRLLASPHYGERWARHWLDVARYTDQTPEWLSSTDRAWLYRDWVARALNEDLPYDRFVTLQLAADMTGDAQPEDLAALGFLGLSPTYWKELKLAPDVIMTVVAEEWDERVDAVSRSFLGLTVSCARCHDHKFDPVSMEDYYALAGVFASTQLTDQPLLPSAEADVVRTARKQVADLEAQLAKIEDKESEAAKTITAQIESIQRETPHYDAPWVHAVEEASLYVLPDGTDATRLETRPNEPRDLPLFRRGNPSNPGEVVPRRFLEVLAASDAHAFKEGSGRLELAESILSDAQPLAARVIVNRVWRHHFGRGIVSTPSNFGTQGSRPTHPELLDDLAARFVAAGWSLKWLHREIMLSAAYRQSSAHRSDAGDIDPDNHLLWRMNRRRLEIEPWRDAMLATAGNLDERLGGPSSSLADAANVRRTLYGTIGRQEMDDMLRLYDFPQPDAHSPGREPTTTPLQQLFVLNSDFLYRQSETLLSRLETDFPDASDEEKINACYRLLFGRPAGQEETQLALKFLAAGGADPREQWRAYVHSLYGLNEFLFVD